MATIFDTINDVELAGTRVQISRKDMNWENRKLNSNRNRFENEKIDTTPHLSLRIDVPYDEIKRIGDYVDNFWHKPSGGRYKDINLTNAQMYEYQLREVIGDAIEKLNLDWHKRLEKRVTKMLAQKETV